jgi:IS30 family transposase
MAKKQQYLTYTDRIQIEIYVRAKLKPERIAERLGRDPSVISRELKRNKGEYLEYSADHAQYFAERRASQTDRRKLLKYPKLLAYVKEKLNIDWSPEQISGRLKKVPSERPEGQTVSHEAIYGYIYEEEPHLHHRLRRKHWERQTKGGRHRNKPVIPDRVPIAERPAEVEDKTILGHFESDSMVGKGHKGGLSVQYGRGMQLAKIHKMRNFTPEETNEAIQATLAALPDDFTKSFTLDNGTENYQHKTWNIPTYFCDPYKPWQKGGVENMNGLIRQYVPKGTDIRKITDEQIRMIEYRLNSRPRKGLDYQTPLEVLAEYKKKVALKT